MKPRYASDVLKLITALIAIGATMLPTPNPAMSAVLDPTTIPKYADSLVIPPAMPVTRVDRELGAHVDYYEIAVKQFQQQILPLPLPATTVWSYGSATSPGTFNYPAFTIETRANKPVRIKWINGLVDESGNYLPHLLPVDQTLHWANPPGGESGKDMEGTSHEPYTGPVPIVTHVHGAHVGPESDGHPEAWFLPNANNIPAGFATKGTHYDQYVQSNTDPGTAVFEYPNRQRATTLWYHDHSLGMTRLNVYAGPAGFYMVRGGDSDLPSGRLPGPAPALDDPAGRKYYEIPIAIQDRSFNEDGSLFYPGDRAFFEGLTPDQLDIPFKGDDACEGPSDVSPIWNPEEFGNTIVVNGRTWPVLNVEPRRYRFRFLNGCSSRTLILRLVTGDPTVRPAVSALPFWQIGSEGGFLPNPVQLETLLINLAERADVIVDFGGLAAGTEVYLINEGPDDPFGGGVPGEDFGYANPLTTGQVMKFVVAPLASPDTSVKPSKLRLPRLVDLGRAVVTRKVSLNELESSTVLVSPTDEGGLELDCEDGIPFGPTQARLGTVNEDGTGNPLKWMDAITENPRLGDTEIWEIHNFTEDAHPIHLHQVMFQVLDRTPIGDEIGEETTRPRELWETGYKDTVTAYPGEVTRIKAKFDIPGLFVWHCHIIEHEDNEMMRPYFVLPPRRDE